MVSSNPFHKIIGKDGFLRHERGVAWRTVAPFTEMKQVAKWVSASATLAIALPIDAQNTRWKQGTPSLSLWCPLGRKIEISVFLPLPFGIPIGVLIHRYDGVVSLSVHEGKKGSSRLAGTEHFLDRMIEEYNRIKTIERFDERVIVYANNFYFTPTKRTCTAG